MSAGTSNNTDKIRFNIFQTMIIICNVDVWHDRDNYYSALANFESNFGCPGQDWDQGGCPGNLESQVSMFSPYTLPYPHSTPFLSFHAFPRISHGNPGKLRTYCMYHKFLYVFTINIIIRSLLPLHILYIGPCFSKGSLWLSWTIKDLLRVLRKSHAFTIN